MPTLARALVVSCALAAFAPAARAQFNNQWLTFAKDQTRIITPAGAAATYILTDPEEKDYAWGDVNHDGWVDLVVVRKQPNTTTGKRVSYLRTRTASSSIAALSTHPTRTCPVISDS